MFSSLQSLMFLLDKIYQCGHIKNESKCSSTCRKINRIKWSLIFQKSTSSTRNQQILNSYSTKFSFFNWPEISRIWFLWSSAFTIVLLAYKIVPSNFTIFGLI
eukprot:NODE_724_length_4780_cov_0.259346.p3 type:complete len:103 gc:universal NODE_724_length_4780_cov_0.259346:4289-4597(+)